MKQFNRLPRWLRVIIPAVVIAVCIAINAVAFTEIVKSFQSRDVSEAASRTAVVSEEASSETSAEEPTPTVKITPAISPDATLDTAVEQARAAKQKATVGKKIAPVSESGSVATATEEGTAGADASEPSGNEPSDSLTTAVTTTPVGGSKGGSSVATGNTANNPATQKAPKYGHLPYSVGDLAEMSLIASYAEGDTQRLETLHPDAATALMEMVAAARADGIWLVPASGFRTVAQQRTLFNAQIAAKGSPEAAALLSAPPGYSEHHTGYAVDLTDGTLAQSEDISIAFAQSPAYAWLIENAAAFQFELSFPENNEQGINYEPWHWRYVGSPEARAIFKSGPAQGESSGAGSGTVQSTGQRAVQRTNLSAGLATDLSADLSTGQVEADRESVE